MLILDVSTLPSSAELPCSSDTPVDNENQNLLPNILLFVLLTIWNDRQDWFFGVDMGIYHTIGKNPRIPIIPDAFLSLGVPRKKEGLSRSSYVLWEENFVPPIFALEMVSQTQGKEYTNKMRIYKRLGVLYYVIYNPDFWGRDRHEPFEVYKLIEGEYQLQRSEPYWMEEVGLGIGRCWLEEKQEEQLAWFDHEGRRYLNPSELLEKECLEKERERLEKEIALQEKERERLAKEIALQEKEKERKAKEIALQEKEKERKAKERLAEYLRSIGVDPDQITE